MTSRPSSRRRSPRRRRRSRGNTVPKFVDPLPTFNGRRVRRHDDAADHDAGVPAEGAAELGLRGPARAVQQRDVPVGLQHQRRRARRGRRERSSRAEGIATTAIYTNSLDQHAAAEPADRRPDDCTGPIRSAPPRATTASTGRRSRPPAPSRISGPIPAVVHLHGNEVLSQYDGHPDAWWTPGVAQRGRAFFGDHVQLREPAGGDDALVPRPRARDVVRLERLRRPRRLLPAFATTATPASPTTRSRCRPGRTRPS